LLVGIVLGLGEHAAGVFPGTGTIGKARIPHLRLFPIGRGECGFSHQRFGQAAQRFAALNAYRVFDLLYFQQVEQRLPAKPGIGPEANGNAGKGTPQAS
jgi:hypothetical protein